MAKLRLAAFTTAMSGKLDTLTFSDTKEGTIMRMRVTPKNPRSASQIATRLAFTKATRQWATLTSGQIAAWEAFAQGYEVTEETTEVVYHSYGFNAFVKLAAKYFAVNPSSTSAPTNPPATSFNGDTAKITADAIAGAVKFTSNAANASKVTTALLLQPLKNKNRKPSATGYRTKVYFTFLAGTLTKDVTVPSGYYAAGYQFVNTDTGQETAPVYITVANPVTFSVVGTDSATKKKAA